MKDVLAIIMAGGRGERLRPLTEDRCKPAVPFGGIYRLIDIPLSNCVNSGIYKVLVFPQYKSQSLVEHLEDGWGHLFSRPFGHYMRVVAPQQRLGEQWYMGTADSVRQNIYLIEREAPAHILILSGDHVYKMDYASFRRYHEEKNADITISLLEVPVESAREFGIAQVDSNFQIVEFEEKPLSPKPMPDDPTHALASMGVYIFRRDVLDRLLSDTSVQDFGKEIIPQAVSRYRVFAYPYRRTTSTVEIPWMGRGSWCLPRERVTPRTGAMWVRSMRTGTPIWISQVLTLSSTFTETFGLSARFTNPTLR